MSVLPERREQIRRAHARLIRQMVMGCQHPEHRPDLEDSLRVADQNGWTDLVDRLRRILTGERSETLLLALDEEDSVIVASILESLRDPSTLPPENAGADPSMAAPGIASIVVAARQGDAQALQWLGQMASQMQRAGGDMARIGACLGPLSRGVMEPERWTRGMTVSGRSLLQQICTEIAKRQAQ